MPSPTSPITPSSVTKLDPQSSAYPVPVGSRHPGITAYDWLAAMAMQGLITHGMEIRADRAMSEDDKDNEIARRAYKIADAMLRTRSQQEEASATTESPTKSG